jgi:hypothetical protein
MSSKGHPPFTESHPSQGQRLSTKGDLASAKGAITKQHHPQFGAPRFPPGENLPPQAKRLKKKAKGGLRPIAGGAKPRDFPNARPDERALRAAREEVGETWAEVKHQAEPVLAEARGHVSGLRHALRLLADEVRAVLRTPAALVHVLRDAWAKA